MQPLGKKWLEAVDHKKADDEDAALQSKLVKFQQSAWKGMAYTLLACTSGYALSGETFWMHTKEFWTGCEASLPCRYQPSPAIRNAYAFQLGFYLYVVPSLLFFEKRKKDHWAMLAHHCATLTLVGHSFILGWTKAGVLIMFMHDIADPFMEMAKMARYCGKAKLTDALFLVFMVAWIVPRDFYFPMWVLRSMLFECLETVVGENSRPAVPHYELMTGLLMLLQILHLYWTFLILRIAYTAVVKGNMEDERESDDD